MQQSVYRIEETCGQRRGRETREGRLSVRLGQTHERLVEFEDFAIDRDLGDGLIPQMNIG